MRGCTGKVYAVHIGIYLRIWADSISGINVYHITGEDACMYVSSHWLFFIEYGLHYDTVGKVFMLCSVYVACVC